MKKILLLSLVTILWFGSNAQQLNLVQDFSGEGLKLDDTAEFSEALYFVSQDDTGLGHTLYSVDNNNVVSPLYSSTSPIFNLVQLGNHVYFTATGSTGWAFYRIDSTGTVSLVSEINAPFLDAINFNNEIFFSSVNDSNLYAYNENNNSFRLIDSNFAYGMSVSGLTIHNGELYFRGEIENGGGNRALFKTDGNSISQVVAFDSRIDNSFGNQFDFVSFGDELYFSPYIDTESRAQLFKINTLSNTLNTVSDYYVQFGHKPYVFDGKLYFSGRNNIDSGAPHELLVIDSSSVISSVPLSSENGAINLNFNAFGSISETSDFYVVANTTQVGYELFSINNGVLELFQDAAPGSTWGVNPNASPVSFNNKLYLGNEPQSPLGLPEQLFELEASPCQNTVDIEDPNFETYIENVLNAGDGVFGNKKVCKELVETITSISISSLNISDLTGIAAFRDLQFLEASSNQLSTVDLSANTNLLSINLDDNQLTSLGVSANTELFALSVNNNQITGLNLSNNGDLVEVRANGNSLQTLNINGLTTLENVQLSSNQLTGTLDFSAQTQLFQLRLDSNFISNLTLPASPRMESLFVSNNPNLSALDVSVITSNFFDIFQATNLPSLSCIQVRDVNEANNEIEWTKDAATQYSLDCSPQPFTVSVSLSGAGGTPPDYTAEEGQQIQLNFEADASTPVNTAYTVQLSLAGGDATSGDIAIDPDAANLQYTFTAKAGNPDNTLLINILEDGIPEPILENLRLSVTPIGSDFTFMGTAVFEITLSDKPYVVTPSISNAGTAPNYTVGEGETFNLSFNADATAINDTTYNPFLSITKDGVADASGDFAIVGLNQPITVSADNPDGSILFTPLDDGNNVGDEVYTIEVRSANSEEYAIADPSSFTITVTDRQNNPVILRTTVVGATPNGTGFSIQEGQNFEIQVEAINGVTGEIINIPIDLSNSSAQPADYTAPNSPFPITIDNDDPDGTLNFQITANDGVESNEVLDIQLGQPSGYQWQDVGGDGSLGIPVTIIDVPSNNIFTVTPSISGAVNGNAPNFEIIEGQSFNLNFESGATATNGTDYSPIIEITKDGIPTSEDFTIVDLDKIFTSNANNPDGFIEFTANADGIDEVDETYTIAIKSEDEHIYTIDTPYEFFLTVKDVSQNQGDIIVKIDNRGGAEGYEVNEQITISLENIDGTEFITAEELTFSVSTNLDGIEQDDWAEENDFELLSNSIVIPAGSSSGTLEISYKDRTDTDDDHEYYNFIISEVNRLQDRIQLPELYKVKIIDSEGYFDVFLTVRGVRYEVLDSQMCCFFDNYYAEEGESVVFSFEAERGVPLGTQFDIQFSFDEPDIVEDDGIRLNNNDIPLANEGQTGAEGDFYLNAPPPIPEVFIDFSVKTDNPDNSLEVIIRKDDVSGEMPERFKVNINKANDGDVNFNLIGDGPFNRDIIIEEPVFASIRSMPNENIASEDPLTPINLMVSISEERSVATPILYKLNSNSTASEDEDFEELSGKVVIPANELSALIPIVPINDNTVELIDETVIIELIDSSGYALTDDDTAQVFIRSEDQPSYEVSLDSEKIEAQESNPSDLAELVFERVGLNGTTLEQPLPINFNFNESSVLEGSDFEVLDANLTVLPFGNNKSVIIPENQSSVTVFVRAIDDNVQEDTEKVTFNLATGDAYSISNSQSSVTIDLISDEIDGSSLDVTKINVQAQSPTCTGEGQKGAIFIENDTGFEFNVEYRKLDSGENWIDAGILNKNSVSGQNNLTVPNLDIGRYEIQLAFTVNNDETPMDAILPTYVVSINILNSISQKGQLINLAANTLDMKVVGSDYYTVSNNGEVYEFTFSNSEENLLKIPLVDGDNQITVKGKVECQGELAASVVYNLLKGLPNPTSDYYYINGVAPDQAYNVLVTDASGRVLFKRQLVSEGTQLSCDLQNLPNGLYFIVLNRENVVNNFKVIKQ